MSEKTGLITGASTGIGAEFAKTIAGDFDKLILTARNKKALDKLAKEISQGYQISCDVITSDLSTEKGAEKLIDHLSKNKIQLDLIINNAGFGLMGDTVELSHAQQMDMVGVNVSALTRLSLYAGENMAKQKKGGIINVASVVGFMPGPYMSVYFASKAYVVSFSEALAVELEKKGVTVTCVCPGATESEFHSRAGMPLTSSRQAAMMPAERVAEIGYDAYKHGKSLVVTGSANKLMTFFTRFVPRRLLARLVVKVLT